MRKYTTFGIAALLVIAAVCTLPVGAVVEERLANMGGLTGDYSYKEGLNSQFHDHHKPLGTHLSSSPDSTILDKTVTNIGSGAFGDRLGKLTFNYPLCKAQHRLKTLESGDPTTRRIDANERIVQQTYVPAQIYTSTTDNYKRGYSTIGGDLGTGTGDQFGYSVKGRLKATSYDT